MHREKLIQIFNTLKKNSYGFTLRQDGELFNPNDGYVVAHKTFDCVETALDNILPHQYLGWWKHDNKEYIEIVEYFRSPLVACCAGYARNQQCIFDFSTKETINIHEVTRNSKTSCST